MGLIDNDAVESRSNVVDGSCLLCFNHLKDSLTSKERFILISQELSDLLLGEYLDISDCREKEGVDVIHHILAIP